LKQNPHWNPEDEATLRRGVEGLRGEPADTSGISATVGKMMAERGPVSRSRPTFRYLGFAGAAAALGLVAFWPRTSSAASLREVAAAVEKMSARYERVYKPNKDGKLEMYMEQWGEPGKYAMRFVGDMEMRYNGKVAYGYWPKTNHQRVIEAEAEEIDSVGVEAFSKFKLLRVVDEGKLRRYVYNIRQDLLIDTTTNLPTQRIAYNNDGSVMEIHEYHFSEDLDDKIFEPDIKPGVPFYNIPEDRERLRGMLAMTPQTTTVAGMKIHLHAVIVSDHGMVGAIVTGGDPRASRGKEVLRISGLRDLNGNLNYGEYTTLAGHGRVETNRLQVNCQPAILEIAQFWNQTVPEKFTIRIPVWKLDPKLPLYDYGSTKAIGIDSRFVGWAEFKVTHPLRTESVESVLPTWVMPSSGGVATAAEGSVKGVSVKK